MKNLLILLIGLFFVLSPYSLEAQDYKNEIAFSYRSFFLSKEHLVFQNWSIFPTIHYTRYLKENRLGIQAGFNHYWRFFPLDTIYGHLNKRITSTFECSVVYRKFHKEKISFFLSSGLIYRDSYENRFVNTFGWEYHTSSLSVLDLGVRVGLASQWQFSDHWYLKANLDYRQHLFRLNKPDTTNGDFPPVFNYMIFDVGIGYGFGKGN